MRECVSECTLTLALATSAAFQNANTSPQSPVSLSGIVPPRSFAVFAANDASFELVFGLAPTAELGGGGPADSNGDDTIQLLFNGVVVDIYGVPGVDGTNEPEDFEVMQGDAIGQASRHGMNE